MYIIYKKHNNFFYWFLQLVQFIIDLKASIGLSEIAFMGRLLLVSNFLCHRERFLAGSLSFLRSFARYIHGTSWSLEWHIIRESIGNYTNSSLRLNEWARYRPVVCGGIFNFSEIVILLYVAPFGFPSWIGAIGAAIPMDINKWGVGRYTCFRHWVICCFSSYILSVLYFNCFQLVNVYKCLV